MTLTPHHARKTVVVFTRTPQDATKRRRLPVHDALTMIMLANRKTSAWNWLLLVVAPALDNAPWLARSRGEYRVLSPLLARRGIPRLHAIGAVCPTPTGSAEGVAQAGG